MKRVTRTGEVAIGNPTINESNVSSSLMTGGLATATTGTMIMPDKSPIPAEYPYRLNTYQIPPSYDVTIEQFEEYAFARLQVLRAVENASMRYQREDELLKAIKAIEDKYLPLHSNESAIAYSLLEERRRDHASHYLLRLAFCNSADNIRWFITQEASLFKIRFSSELSRERLEFVKANNSDLSTLTVDEKKKIFDQLSRSSPGKEQDEFFKVPFELVPDLVARRLVYLQKGWAYVPRTDSFSIVMTKFKESLEYWMERTAKELPLLRDERIMPLLSLVKTTDVRETSDSSKGFIQGKLAADSLDSASNHFPLCMQQLYSKGKQDSHLKYGGRQQLGLFLKGIGLPLEEAILFWRKLFAPKCGDDGFNKNYLYNVRHNYGQEGKRANYGPAPCSKIITGPSPSTGDHHGCPFRHSSIESLTSRLASYTGPTGVKLNDTQVGEITEMSKSNQCQAACTRLFEHTRGQTIGTIDTFAFPSKFFEASTKLSSVVKKNNK